MLFVPAFVVCASAIDDAGVELRIPDRPWHLELRPRGDFGILSFAWPDTPYAILLLLERRRIAARLVREPPVAARANPVGFDTVDHALDVLVPLDRSSWTWKDEDELAEAIALGLFTEADAASFRYWGERAVEHLVLRQPPFDEDWEDWRPDPRGPRLSFRPAGTSSDGPDGTACLPRTTLPSFDLVKGAPHE